MKDTYQVVSFPKIIAVFFLTAIVLFSAFPAGRLPAAQAEQSGTQSLSGWFTVIRGDSQDGATKEIYTLATEAGRSIELQLDERVTAPVGGLPSLDRKQITVRGDWSGVSADGDGAQTFQVTSIAPLQDADLLSTAVTGPQKWISILCKFQDVAAEPKSLSYFQNMYRNSRPGLDHFWRELSYNRINMLGSTASGWYTLPHPHDYYMSGPRFDLDKAARECTGVANPSVDFSTHAGINLMFNSRLDGFAWGGGSYLTLDGVTKVWKMTWLGSNPRGYPSIAVVEHEMGHAYGLHHSGGNYGRDYDNEWDLMSDTRTGCRNRGGSDPVYGCLGQHMIAYQKDQLGWIRAAQKMIIGAGTARTLVLERLALPQTTNLKMIKIPIGGSSTRFYTVEARRLNGYDFQLPGNAVILHDVNTTRPEPVARVIDIDNNGVTGDAGAMWTTGEIFRDPANRIAVAVLARTASGFRVHVTSGVNIYYITGNIGASNVTITYTGGSTRTDATGKYIFPVPAGWSGTVRPSKPGYTFSPVKRTYSNVTADKKAQNFSWTSTFTISGTTGIAGTTLRYTTNTPHTVISQTNGRYSLRAPGGWSGLVTPSHPCYSFSPANRHYTDLSGNQTAQNYTPSFNSDSGCADIYATVGGSNQGRFGLLPERAVRKSFPNRNNGPVKIFSDNDVPLFASERVIYKVNNVAASFSEMMGLPNSQLDRTYWLPWYNNKTINTQLWIANPSRIQQASVEVTIGGAPVPGSPFTVEPGDSMPLAFAGIDNGPVKIMSNIHVVAAERILYKVNGVDTSYSEVMALPAGQLDTTYWLPWYDNVNLDTQLRIANVSDTPATVHVSIGGTPVPGSPFTVNAGVSLRKIFPGIGAGPVKIESDVNILAAERVIYKANGVNTSFSEMMALPNKQLNSAYWMPWYDNTGMDTQLRLVNVSDTTATVHVRIGRQEVPGSPFTLEPGAILRRNFTGINAGPVKIESDVNIIAAERVIYKNANGAGISFSEMMALSNGVLDSMYWFPWYNNVNLDTQLRFGTP